MPSPYETIRPVIQFENLTKTFRVHQKEPGLKGSIQALWHRKYLDKQALKSVSAKIEAGEIVGLVGANGAGKTTLVKLLSGIVHPTSGSADVLGFKPWERRAEFRRQIALIMGQKAQLWWDLPAADCFLLLREIYRIPPVRFNRSLDELVEALGVKDQLKIQIRRLSLGERMKMELIAALVHEPKVVYLDEPTIGLDLTAQRAVREFLLEYRRRHRPAMILTSHYMEDIESLCERLMIIREGSIVYDGGLKKILSAHGGRKQIIARLSQADAQGKTEIRIDVSRDRVAETAAEVLRNHPVADLVIEEEDIGVLIERLIRQGVAAQ